MSSGVRLLCCRLSAIRDRHDGVLITATAVLSLVSAGVMRVTCWKDVFEPAGILSRSTGEALRQVTDGRWALWLGGSRGADPLTEVSK